MRNGTNAKRFTDRYLQTLKVSASNRVEVLDTEAPGLVLRVTPNGVKSWAIRYRAKGRAQRRSTFGTYPAISLADARSRAKDIAAAAARGIDLPQQEDEEAEKQRRADHHPATMAGLLDRYVADYCKPNQRRWQMTERLFAMHVKPAIGNIPLIALRRAELVELLDDLQNGKGFRAQVNRVRSQVIAALNWAIEREYLDTNPAAAIKKRKIEASRDRVLSNDELVAIWRAAEALSEPSRSLIKAWMLTGQRRDEVRCMMWQEVALSRGVWTLPAARNKGKRDHEIPLSRAMLTLISELPRLGEPVFTTNGRNPYGGQKRLKAILDRTSGVTGWTFHDFRRTTSTGMAALGIPQDTIDRVLNHAKGTLAGTYNRHQYLDEKRRALELWAEHVALVVGRYGEDVDMLRVAPGVAHLNG